MLASATEYYNRQQRVTLAAIIRAEKAKGAGPAEVAKVVAAFQVLATREATTALTNMLDEQRIDITPVAIPTPLGLVGSTSAGFPLEAPFQQPLTNSAFAMIVATQLQDVARNVIGLGVAVRPRMGYVRQINAGACSRCAILAGRFYRWSDGFLRHPRCGCKNIPAQEGESIAGITMTPDEYFDSLPTSDALNAKYPDLTGDMRKEAGLYSQEDIFTKSGAKAIRDGADMSQVVNVYRRSAGMQFAQQSPIKVKDGLKFTTEGTTKHGIAGQAQLRLRQNGPQQMRPMPETIYQRAGDDRAKAMRMLKLYGYVR